MTATGSVARAARIPANRTELDFRAGRRTVRLARRLEKGRPDLITAEFRVADRPRGRVLVDYNQNAWGRTLASVYSVRPNEFAGVSTPVTWEEVGRGFEVANFRLENVPARVRRLGDLWKPLLAARCRFRLEEVL